ncbi:MAG: hypothetical protein ACRD24_04200 [Terriglobales bacterium]
MGRINWGRVVLGGVLWFVVYNVLGGAAAVLYLVREGREAFHQLGLRVVSHMSDPGFLAFVLLLTLVLGMFSIWLYAAIRPRYGPGPKTAVGVGFAVWIIGHLLPGLYWSQLLGLPIRLVALNEVTALVVGVAATLAGAWLYKE